MLTQLEVHEGPTGFTVQGRFRSFTVSADGRDCTCGLTGGCAHREALSAYLAGEIRSCPSCHGNGLRHMERADLSAVMSGDPVESYTCAGCGGAGSVSARRRAALEAGLKRQRGGKAAA